MKHIFINDPRFTRIKPFDKKVWLSSPTMHGDEQHWVDDAIETNWVSTIGANINEVERLSAEKIGRKDIALDVKEVSKPDADAQLVAENVAAQLENRVSFRRAVKSCMTRTMKKDQRGNSLTGAQGIKVCVSGRLGGADIARSEFYSEGTIPLQTLRADIDYGFAEADTTYGKIGVKVWIYKGEVLPTKSNKDGRER